MDAFFVAFKLKQIDTYCETMSNNGLKELNMTRSQMKILMYLYSKNGICQQKQLEKEFGISHTSIVGLLRRMEQKNLLKTQIDENDRRNNNVILLSEGLALQNRLSKFHTNLQEKFEKHMSNEELTKLYSLLSKYYDIMNLIVDENSNNLNQNITIRKCSK